MKKNLLYLFILVTMVLSACSGGAEVTNTPAPDPGLVLTAAAQTAEAFRLATQAAEAAKPSPTPEPSATPTLEPTPTATLSPTPEPPTITPSGPDLRAEFIVDVTIPDGTAMAPNQAFTKTWRLKNNGRLTWTPSYSLVFLNGEKMGAPDLLPLPYDVPPGASIDLSVNMIAPLEPGKHLGNWMLKDPNGVLFGIGEEGKWAFYVDIVVLATTGTPATPTATVSAAATASPTATTGALFSNIALNVDSSSATGCPHTFNFTAQFSTSRDATVTYQLDVNSDVTVTLPPPVTTNLQAGQHSAIYQLTFTSAVNGTAIFHLTSPEEVLSNPIAFSLACP
jgi:hypothetical protein